MIYTDFWEAYRIVLPPEQHVVTTGKGDGQTCHIERFNNTLRQRLVRLTRQTMAFSKTDEMHESCLKAVPAYLQPAKTAQAQLSHYHKNKPPGS